MTPPPGRLVAAASAGGALGAVLRALVEVVQPDLAGFAWTTFAINVAGALALAALPAVGWVRRSDTLTVGLGTGVLGGFTTLSATSEQARALVEGGRTGLAALYLVGTLAAALVAVAVAARLVGRSDGAGHEQEQREPEREEGDR